MAFSYSDLISAFNGDGDVTEINLLRKYTGGQPIHIDKLTGLVFVKNRRESKDIADEWSNTVYLSDPKKSFDFQYTGMLPIMKARHLFAIDSLNKTISGGLKGKSILDIGAGEGYFLKLAKEIYGAKIFGIEPSQQNCINLDKQKIPNFNGTAENYFSSISKKEKFDFVTLNWTLCNCSNINDVMRIAFELLNEDGYIMVSDSSRLLTPFKKSLSLYFQPSLPLDLHAWFFSFNSIRCLMVLHGFVPIFQNNHHEQNDLITIAAKKTNCKIPVKPEDFFDNYKKVINFFERWDEESQFYQKQERGGFNLLSK